MSDRGLEQSESTRSDADSAPLVVRKELGASENVPRRALFHQPASGRRRITDRRWVNPYVHKLGKVSSSVVGSDRPALSEDEVSRLRERLATASRAYVELGSGSGIHLIEQANRHRDALWVGFELRFKRVVRTAEKALERGIENLLVVRTDALTIQEILPPQSLDGVFVNFPDPWDKRRWKKHRLLGEESIKHVHALLKPGGKLSFKTDHRGYFEDVLSSIHSGGLFDLDTVSLDLHRSELVSDNVVTEFEQLFVNQGLPIFCLKASRAGTSGIDQI